MSDSKTNSQYFFLESSLFKGRSDWYFCFLKLERVAHVCAVLADKSVTKDASELKKLRLISATLPGSVLYFAAGEVSLAKTLADLLSVIFEIRLGVARGLITKENGSVLVQECEMVAEKLHNGARLSPPLSSDDFAVNEMLGAASLSLQSQVGATGVIKDKSQTKGFYIKDIKDKIGPLGVSNQSDRASKIVDFVNKNNPVSIKDITLFVRNCSEKTIQRELNALIGRGILQRTGERRWSQYSPAQ